MTTEEILQSLCYYDKRNPDCTADDEDIEDHKANRNEAVVLTFLPDPKWVNDYAVAQVIRALKSRIDELEAVK